jgi:hypothetical protein
MPGVKGGAGDIDAHSAGGTGDEPNFLISHVFPFRVGDCLQSTSPATR